MSAAASDASLAALVERARSHARLRTAVVHPCDRVSLESALACARLGLMDPVLVANEAKLRALAERESLSLDGCEIVTAAHSHDAAAVAARLARDGAVKALMKGSLHSDELLHEVTRPDSGLHTERRISHAYVMESPALSSLLLISDAVVNVAPGLEQKRDIVQNAVDLAHALGISGVFVAALSAIETVNPNIVSTMDAAALSKMAERGEISGALLDGPLALDDALDARASAGKGIVSAVAGRANVLLVPDFESGNMLAKALILLAGARAAGIVLGARVPVILTSRADDLEMRVASAALAVLLAHPRG